MAETTPTEGMSKKQLDKLAKKEKKKDSTNSDTNNNSSANDAKFTVLFNKTNPPLLTRVIDIISQSQCSIKYTINKIMPDNSLPILIDSDLLDGSIAGDVNIVKYFLRTVTTSSITSLYSSTNPWYLSQVDQWLDVYNLCQTNSGYATTTIPTLLNNHLSNRTYLVGDDLTIADLAMIFVLLQSNYVSTTDQPHFCRWMKLASLSFPADVLTTSIPLHFAPIPKLTEVSGAGKKETNKAGKVTTDSKAKTAEVVDEGGTCPPLEGAIEGQVCTRFPPEPSGYLHIGHAKAVLLNQYYAQRYKGKLLVRFDDTNPSKEKEEFQENIIQDLATLRVFPDKV